MADSGNQPLKLLDIVVSGMGMDPTTGLWLTPLHVGEAWGEKAEQDWSRLIDQKASRPMPLESAHDLTARALSNENVELSSLVPIMGVMPTLP